jgi:SIR2-like protein
MSALATLPEWPDVLVDLISQHDYVLFVGAGISSNSQNSLGHSPPRWRELIEALSEKFLSGSSVRAAEVLKAIRTHDLLTAAEIIQHHCMENSRIDDFRNEIAKRVDGGSTAESIFQKNPIHDLISALDPRIIFTTNYDKILERHFKYGFRILSFDSKEIAATVRQGHPVIVKLHGSVDQAGFTILTRLDFTRLRREGSHALDTIEALLLTRTALFVGYSLDDPDLRLVLENQFGSKGVRPAHYLLTHRERSEIRRALLREAYGVNLVEYSGEHGAGVNGSLTALVDRVAAIRNVVP